MPELNHHKVPWLQSIDDPIPMSLSNKSAAAATSQSPVYHVDPGRIKVLGNEIAPPPLSIAAIPLSVSYSRIANDEQSRQPWIDGLLIHRDIDWLRSGILTVQPGSRAYEQE